MVEIFVMKRGYMMVAVDLEQVERWRTTYKEKERQYHWHQAYNKT